MRLVLLSSCIAFAASQIFESENFNITDALIFQGVDISALPQLNAISKRSPHAACSIACSSLKTLYGNDAIDFENESAYATFTSNFWSSISAEVRPYCVFKPSTPSAVSVMVLLSRLSQCPFAVKSGGHSAFAGGATIEGGITMSFENMKQIKLSSDRTTVALQPGNVWEEVLTALSTTGVTVTGGRIGDIGVGGLTLGGGISFLTNEYGLACDNVASFEVVTASGIIVKATPKHFPDLYWALRGGGNNLGIVTSFELQTKPLKDDLLFGGTRVYTEDVFDDVIQAWTDLTLNSPQDPKAGTWAAFMDRGAKLAAIELWHGAPLANGSDSIGLAPFYNISAISDSTKTRGHAAYVTDLKATNTYGVREIFYDLSVKMSYEMASRSVDIFYETIGNLTSVDGVYPVLIWQQIVEGSLKGSARNGGNAMGFSPADGPLQIIMLACQWNNAADDDKVYEVMSDIMKQVKDASVELGVANDWVYMNYASQFQDVITSYGDASKAKLKTVAGRYDPKAVFQKLQPGYFKLDRAPVSGKGYFSH